ncbi:hypothetical protein MKK69_26215 [Methylobacterium sp. J-026]|uniref:hypothetical protein n=1 Tax=Methylobacterium sp. J-026 TaxID=2836624 RepID=UPI001FBAFC5F|nr:hypothetical protein [Methylobacterium sp. J-026]MCJ2137496.1 hypothetical protein [Methylobacterium sp. J-026]
MSSRDLARRLARLEAACRTTPVRLTPEQTADAARRYEATLHQPGEPDPRAVAYWATAALPELAEDYAAMCRGAPAPWE